MLTTIKAWQDRYFHFWDRLNVLRAGILGANDGIISVSGIVLGAVGADLSATTLFISGISGMLAGACSMAGGEYVSVSAQKEVQLSKLGHTTGADLTQTRLREIDLLNPLHAAATSFVSFILGALIPLLAISLSTPAWRLVNTILAMVVALSLNATVSAQHAAVSLPKVILRNVLVGVATALITFLMGTLLGGNIAG
ncbi:VIT1/CCC1 transporter family protein [Lactiplantibacillus sp. WILCCON 0030]|uniref:VIT1/CCC1 transporter family protein n=1 Tax=Lactiplantibacillus brownii TaxID=3069269 RepID=A0ABU1ABC6_9LACO|nr:VIT1/CCC1 transporter family protein [Lactiplantibacillus brownii]MDQ7938256.1 VIT1/CCC1 transporter family protein [Lactiplantibacillus brownii]